MNRFSVYSDESGINKYDPYTSIAVVSGEESTLKSLRTKLSKIIEDKNIKEVKFVGVTKYGSTITQAARKFIECTLDDFACYHKVRVDIITRNNQLVHSNTNSSNEPQLEHLYYCLLSHIIRQWQNVVWDFYPDVNSKINWSEIIDYLENTRLHRGNIRNPLLIDLVLEENPRFRFNEVQQLHSINEPLIQLTDLFAGMARFSNEENSKCVQYALSYANQKQGKFQFPFGYNEINVHKSRECRYRLIGDLYHLCGKHKLYVSLREKKHLWTRRHKSPINFWDYKPNK